MACQWRIRHKLIVGLGLVVGIMALLLFGTLKGLASYRATMNSIDSKLGELHSAQDLNAAVTDLAATDSDVQAEGLRARAGEARKALRVYRDRLQDTLDRGRDPDQGYNELQLLDALGQRFDALERAVDSFDKEGITLGARKQVRRDAAVEHALADLVRASAELEETIYSDLGRRILEAKGTYRVSMAVVLSTSSLGVLLMAGLLRFFYGWVFYPLRDLQQGAGRVAQGDFAHRIEVHSGDEMEELAAAFNHMTARLQMIYADLAHQVNERSRQLVRSERLAGVGFLAAGVAHEINNPLASIAFCSEALEARLRELFDRRPAGLDEQRATVEKYLRMIQEEAFRCKEITQRLLEFSRGGERRRKPVDLAELVQAVLDMVQHLQNCKGKDIAFQPARVVAWVNSQEIKSVILNLVVNALDSMEDGGRLTIALGQEDGQAVLRFADTGCGMTAEVLENIFEPFFTRSRTGKGTGLGLTISHRIVCQHGGDIEAASPGPDQGSTFTVRLALKPAEEEKAEGRRQKAEGGPAEHDYRERKVA